MKKPKSKRSRAMAKSWRENRDSPGRKMARDRAARDRCHKAVVAVMNAPAPPIMRPFTPLSPDEVCAHGQTICAVCAPPKYGQLVTVYTP